MKVLSKQSEYGLRALMYMAAQRQHDSNINIREMSEELDISFHFLTKILQTLTQSGILNSYRGPRGGISFAKPPEKITLHEVVIILEGSDYFLKCLLGLPSCGEKRPCPLHDFWKEIREQLKTEFLSTSIATLSEKVGTKKFRLSP